MSKPGGCHSSEISLGDALRLPKDIRHGGGAKLNLALVRNVRTWPAEPDENAYGVFGRSNSQLRLPTGPRARETTRILPSPPARGSSGAASRARTSARGIT